MSDERAALDRYYRLHSQSGIIAWWLILEFELSERK